MRCFAFVASLFGTLLASFAAADNWGQWRGPQRDGVAHASPLLRDDLPEDGLQPQWISNIDIPSAGAGGWGSPAVADGRVYLFSHTKTKVSEGALPPLKYPPLTEEQKASMSEEEIADYEARRREERLQRNNDNFEFHERLHCFHAETGGRLWTNERPSVFTWFPQSGTPLVAEGRVYILGAGLQARCIDAVSGEDLWTTRLPGEFRDEHLHSSFALAEGTAVVLAGPLFGLDAQSGAVRWEGADDLTGQHASPAVWKSGGREWIIVNVRGGKTVCIDPQTGKERWRLDSQANSSTPVVAGDRLLTYGGSRKAGLRCYDLTQDPPELLWNYQRVADSGSSPVSVNGLVFVQGERRLACVDLETGQAAWSTLLDLEQPRYTSLAAADGQVFYAFEGVLCFAAADEYQEHYNAKIDNTGLLATESHFREKLNMAELERTAEGQKEAQQLWRTNFRQHSPLACASPALADGRLYVRTRTGVACYDLRAE